MFLDTYEEEGLGAWPALLPVPDFPGTIVLNQKHSAGGFDDILFKLCHVDQQLASGVGLECSLNHSWREVVECDGLEVFNRGGGFITAEPDSIT